MKGVQGVSEIIKKIERDLPGDKAGLFSYSVPSYSFILQGMEQICFSKYLLCQDYFTTAAMHSISTRASFGRVLTATAQRAGKGALKNSE